VITPNIYPWTREQVLSKLKKEAESLLPELNNDELSNAMFNIASRMTELASQRLNRLPDKALLQFLAFAGKDLVLASPAQAPVKFTKSERAETNPLVPARSQVATPASDFAPPITFETLSDLYLGTVLI
jgi:hypothetical protein